MAGGEKAKSSGEYGEAIVGSLIKLMGWENPNNGISVPCVFQEKHGKQKHGIDYIYQYRSPLRDATRQDVLISVKCRDGYPATEDGVKKKFKEFLLDLAQAMECYPGCDIAKRKINNITKKLTYGLIFWIDRNREDGREFESVSDKIGNFYLKEECTYDVISLVDNQRAQFLYSLLNFAKNKYGEANVEYFYINTGLNKEYLLRLIGLAQELTNTWTANVVIAFPDYNEFENSSDVLSAKNEFENTAFVSKIEVITFNPDFRDGVK